MFQTPSTLKRILDYPFKKISYKDSLDIYGTDKPDLRNPLTIKDVTNIFKDSNFKIFSSKIKEDNIVKCIIVPNIVNQPRSFFDKLNEWSKSEGAAGLGYINFINMYTIITVL